MRKIEGVIKSISKLYKMKFIGESYCRYYIFTRCRNKCFLKFLDIGANLTDEMFQGIYNGSQKHPSDLDIVLDRSWKSGLDKIIITVGCLSDRQGSIDIAAKDGTNE